MAAGSFVQAGELVQAGVPAFAEYVQVYSWRTLIILKLRHHHLPRLLAFKSVDPVPKQNHITLSYVVLWRRAAIWINNSNDQPLPHWRGLGFQDGNNIRQVVGVL